MWTPTELASNARSLGGTLWRAVEHQYTVSTRRIVDRMDEQALLEDILEETKPVYPPEADGLHYLLKTPFRYDAPYPNGSRFRRSGPGAGVFYAAEKIRTSLAEFISWRLRFFKASPATPFPKNEGRLTVFSANYQTAAALDLTVPPLDRDRSLWMQPRDYSATQALADTARAAAIEALRYESVRDVEGDANIAVLTPRAFTTKDPVEQQTWFLYMDASEANCVRTNQRGEDKLWTFPRDQFD
ncbi:MAG: RES domain family protein [Gammaproteobacteria bacterium]|nr:MAG: RES domain family protein [Gammaproteobacteria bacterium]TND01134.1 MAG: RES domain family protein [Gammaproteobacteria bacterium]